MNKEKINKLKGILIVPIGLSLVLIPFSIYIGWNIFTTLLFWFIIAPCLTIILPVLFSKNPHHLYESLLGLMIFYAINIFMIYEHYKSDYFLIMILSLISNIILISAINRILNPRKQTQ